MSLFILYKITFSWFCFVFIFVTMKTVFCTGHLNSCAFPILPFSTRQKQKQKSLSKIFLKIQVFLSSSKTKLRTSFWSGKLLIWLIVTWSILMRCGNSTLTSRIQCWELMSWKIKKSQLRYFALCSREYYSGLKYVCMQYNNSMYHSWSHA